MFKPLHQDHAIETVILKLTGSGEMTEHERAILDDGYEKYWKAVLPTVSHGHVVEVTIGPKPSPDGGPKPLVPTHYVEFTRTGEPAWWMAINGTNITIGCTQYGGWKSVSQKAYGLFANLGRVLGKDHPIAQIRSAELTYHDLFVWHGADADYDSALAIQQPRIPPKARNSKMWHTGEGWIDDRDGEQILERFHIGAELRQEENQVRPIIKVVTTSIWGFGVKKACMRLDRAFENIRPADANEHDGRVVYNTLHERIYGLFENLITKEIADQIGFHPPGESK